MEAAWRYNMGYTHPATHHTGDIDDTYYIGVGNPFMPGMRVFNSLGDDKSPNVNEFTSGIFVHKDGKHKVTLAAHAYDDLSGSLPLSLFQGNEKHNSEVAVLDELVHQWRTNRHWPGINRAETRIRK
jgi:hypothetical protein